MPFRVAGDRPGQVRDRALELVTVATPAAASLRPAVLSPAASSPADPHPAAKASGGQPAPAGPDGLGAEPWHLHAEQLRPLLASGASLDYARFFNPDLLERTRRIYRADLAFLAAAQRRGVIDRATHASLTSL